jgi:putative transposase
VSCAGYYSWLKDPLSNRAKEDLRLLDLIRTSYQASHRVYGAPRILQDLRELGETCSKHRVAKIMRAHNIRALHGYRAPRYVAPKVSDLIPNHLQRKFDVAKPNKAWGTDITYIRTWEGWLYLAVVIDFFSRKVIGWATRSKISRDVVLDALKMAVRDRHPKKTLIHSDQGCQFSSDEWRRYCRSHGLTPSMSRRGNCWDNAVVESFFGSLKKERIKKRIYDTRAVALVDVTDYIQNFYNAKRRHTHLNGLSPNQFESQFPTLRRCP